MNFLYIFFGAGDEENAEPHIKHVYFRQFLPVSPKVKLWVISTSVTFHTNIRHLLHGGFFFSEQCVLAF